MNLCHPGPLWSVHIVLQLIHDLSFRNFFSEKDASLQDDGIDFEPYVSEIEGKLELILAIAIHEICQRIYNRR